MITTSETCYSDLGHLRVKVFCDGSEVKWCTSMCIDEGWATRSVKDDKGSFLVKGDEFVIEKIYGVITWEPVA